MRFVGGDQDGGGMWGRIGSRDMSHVILSISLHVVLPLRWYILFLGEDDLCTGRSECCKRSSGGVQPGNGIEAVKLGVWEHGVIGGRGFVLFVPRRGRCTQVLCCVDDRRILEEPCVPPSRTSGQDAAGEDSETVRAMKKAKRENVDALWAALNKKTNTNVSSKNKVLGISALCREVNTNAKASDPDKVMQLACCLIIISLDVLCTASLYTLFHHECWIDYGAFLTLKSLLTYFLLSK